MGFFKTKDPKTGEPRLGAGVYIIICSLMIGGAWLWNARQHADDPKIPGASTGNVTVSKPNPSSVAPVAEAVEKHQTSAVQDEPPGVATAVTTERDISIGDGPNIDPTQNIDNGKQSPDEGDSVENTIDLLRQNQEKIEQEKQAAADAAAAKARAEAEAEAAKTIEALRKKASAVSISTQPADNSKNAPGASVTALSSSSSSGPNSAVRNVAIDEQENQISVNPQMLTIYEAPSDAATAQALIAAGVKNAKVKTGFQTGNFLPRGFMFPVYILTTVQTVDPTDDIVTMAVAENVIYQHKVQIPFGTRILGSASGSSFEERVNITADTIVYPDGREQGIGGLLKDPYDLSKGVRGYYIPQPLRVQLVPYVNEFIATFTEAAAQRYSGSNSYTVNPTTGQVGTQSISGASDLIRQQAQKIQERLDRRYPEKVVIPIGTKAYVQLNSNLDLTLGEIGYEPEDKDKVGTGNEENIVSKNTSPGVGVSAAQQDAMAQAAIRASDQQAQAYGEALKQLGGMQAQLDKLAAARKNGSATGRYPYPSNTPAASTPPPNINWPDGDIQ